MLQEDEEMHGTIQVRNCIDGARTCCRGAAQSQSPDQPNVDLVIAQFQGPNRHESEALLNHRATSRIVPLAEQQVKIKSIDQSPSVTQPAKEQRSVPPIVPKLADRAIKLFIPLDFVAPEMAMSLKEFRQPFPIQQLLANRGEWQVRFSPDFNLDVLKNKHPALARSVLKLMLLVPYDPKDGKSWRHVDAVAVHRSVDVSLSLSLRTTMKRLQIPAAQVYVLAAGWRTMVLSADMPSVHLRKALLAIKFESAHDSCCSCDDRSINIHWHDVLKRMLISSQSLPISVGKPNLLRHATLRRHRVNLTLAVDFVRKQGMR